MNVMSVIKAKRSESKLQVIVKALEMCEYTIRICKHEKHFPKSDRWLITSRITAKAEEVVEHIREANDIKIETLDDYMARRNHQVAAHGCCESLLSLIEISYKVIGLEGSRVEYWTGLIVNTEDLIQRWRRSDQARNPQFAKYEEDAKSLVDRIDNLEMKFIEYMECDREFKQRILELIVSQMPYQSQAPDGIPPESNCKETIA